MKKIEIPKEELENLYSNGQTLKELGERYQTTPATILKRLDEHNIPIRTRTESHTIALEKFGSPKPKGSIPWNRHIARTPAEKAKISQGQRARYASGAVHPNQDKHLSPLTKQRIGVSNKVAQTELWQDLDFKEQQLKKLFGGVEPTPYESKLTALIEKYDLPFRWNANGKVMLDFCIPDFVGIGNNCFIEVHDKKRAKSYHAKRTDVFASYGFRVLFILNEEISLPNWEDICLAKIRDFIAQSIARLRIS